MALTALQRRILKAIAGNRAPDSHVAGGAALMARSGRFSEDIDIFHDAPEAVSRSAQIDDAALRADGLSVELLRHSVTFIEAIVQDEVGNSARIQWAQDSAIRFFPAIEDEVFGYRLHDLDLAINKVLAMAGRREPRDYYDVVQVHKTLAPLAALAWAAPAKDPGFTPELILDQINWHSNYLESQILAEIHADEAPDVKAMKAALLAASNEAREAFKDRPLDQVGYLYLDGKSHARFPKVSDIGTAGVKLHGATVRGAWPVLAQLERST